MASISSATSLATFPLPHASSSKLPHISLNPVLGSDEQLAVAAVQGDGVWTYDLSTLRPTTSFTCPPSTIFSTKPISYHSKVLNRKDKQKAEEETLDIDMAGDTVPQRVTLVGVYGGEDVGDSVWVWEGEEAEKKAIQLDVQLHSLHYLDRPYHPVLAVTTKGQLIVLTSDLKPLVLPILKTKKTEFQIITAAVLKSQTDALRIVTVDIRGNVRSTLLSIDDEGARVAPGNVGSILPNNGHGRQLVSADISPEGVISAIDLKRHLVSAHVDKLDQALATNAPVLVHPSESYSLASLPSTTKPVVVFSSPHPEPSIVLAVPSPSLPAVLAVGPISSLAGTGGIISHISVLDASTPNQFVVGVVLTHHGATGDSGRSIIHTCELSLPANGVGLNSLLGTQFATKTYLSFGHHSGHRGSVSVSQKMRDLLATATNAIGTERQAALSAAEQLWQDYLKQQDPKTSLSVETVKAIARAVFSAALRTEEVEGDGDNDTVPTGVYARSIVRNMLDRSLLKQDAVESGLINALLALEDWDNIVLAIQSIPTLPSSALLDALKASLPLRDQRDAILQAVVNGPAPAPDFRVELKQRLSVEEATIVLAVLVRWAEEHVERRGEGLSAWSEPELRAPAISQDTDELPTLNAVINYSSALLDSHLPLFLSHPPAYTWLERLGSSLGPLLEMQDDLRKLRGPVSALLTLASREEKRRAEVAAKKAALGKEERNRGPGAWREERRKEREGAGRGVGEEAVGLWKVEDFVF
ncbi:hypothetical protein BCR39DRAFT_545369 [Naematelia encephala]|uniref:Uncharacterized protein n=1 Tax=Naematelia encephala TaxID=71784 RepID=A0A1Y2AQZ8_9TREE|nr:hypothetical protein BCR39DRAFT_545369 [Naematelia encephala]